MNIQPVILCGGSGTRLWPLSREKHPKQLLALAGDDTLLQATVRRLDGMEAGDNVTLNAPLVVCNEEYRFVIAEQMRVMDRHARIVLEPAGRNTAPALTLAALAVHQDQADAVLLVMPADHVMLDVQAFLVAVRQGAELANKGLVVTFGITPDAPETSYGYIWYDQVDAGMRFRVKRIVVKPQGSLSLQMHHHRAEHWVVVRGTARVTRGDDVFLMSENQSTFIPLGTKHRLENPGCLPLEMIEVQSGAYLDEDDIVRFEDLYGR